MKVYRIPVLGCLLAGLLLAGAVQAVSHRKVVELLLPDMQGRTYDLQDYRGKWVVLNFWATWCPPCREEIPELALFHERHRDEGVVLLGVNFEDVGRADLQEFIDEQFIDYPVLRMPPARNTPLGPIFGLPTTFVISPEGRIAKVHVGAVTMQELESYMRVSRD